MKTTYSNGHLNIHLGALMDTLDDNAKTTLIDYLGCETAIIKAVTEQILDGWTEDGSHGATSAATPEPNPSCGLDWARREVARRAGDAARLEIKRLEQALAMALAEIQRYRDMVVSPKY